MITYCVNAASAFLEQHREAFFDDAKHCEVESELVGQTKQDEEGQYIFSDGSVLVVDAYKCAVTAHPAPTV